MACNIFAFDSNLGRQLQSFFGRKQLNSIRKRLLFAQTLSVWSQKYVCVVQYWGVGRVRDCRSTKDLSVHRFEMTSSRIASPMYKKKTEKFSCRNQADL